MQVYYLVTWPTLHPVRMHTSVGSRLGIFVLPLLKIRLIKSYLFYHIRVIGPDDPTLMHTSVGQSGPTS